MNSYYGRALGLVGVSQAITLLCVMAYTKIYNCQGGGKMVAKGGRAPLPLYEALGVI